MARFKDQAVMEAALAAHLEPGETLRHAAYGVKQPPVWLLALGFLAGIIPAVIIIVTGTKEYVVGLTDRRFIALRFKSSRIEVQEVLAWRLEALPPVRTSTGGLFTHIAIADPARPFVAKFHRLGTPDNRAEAMAIAAGLERQRGGI
jgi:hypothetical protein